MAKYTIKNGDKQFNASEYQEKIFDKIIYGSGDLIINASAGSSKTTTIINCLDKLGNKRALFVAFNKSIVIEIRDKIGKKDGIKITTFHGLGYQILCEHFGEGKIKIQDYKYKNYIKNNIDLISSEYSSLNSILLKNKYIDNIIKLTNYSRYYLYNKTKKIEKVAEKYGIITIGNEVEVCKKVLEWGMKNIDMVDYTDLVWLPNALNLTTHRCIFDWIFIDEGQDISTMEMGLIEKCKGRGCRMVIVGDNDQQINTWAGSNEEIFEKFKKSVNTEEFELPISYRCPKKIVEFAQKFSKRIKYADNAEEGEIRHEISKNEPTDGDMVLCRTTAPLIDLHLYFMKINKKSFIKGSEKIREKLLNLISESKSDDIDLLMTKKDGLIVRLYEKLWFEIENFKKAHNTDDEDAIMFQDILDLYDQIEAIKIISEGQLSINDLIERIKVIFPEFSEGITLSTVHKAKGLEADNVYILYNSLMPSKMAKTEWEIKSEINLQYVAYTRAKKTLNFIKEENKWNFKKGYMSPKETVNYVRGIMEHIKKLN